MTSTSVWRWRDFWLVWSPWWCHGISVQCWWWGQFCPIKMNDLHLLQRDVHKTWGWRRHQIPLLKLPFSFSCQLQKDVSSTQCLRDFFWYSLIFCCSVSDKLDQLRCKLFCGGSPKLMKYYVSSTLSVINQFEINAHQLQMHLEEEFNWKLWWKWNDNCELNLQTGLSEESANRCSESVAKDFLMDVRCNLLLSLLLRTSQNPTAVRAAGAKRLFACNCFSLVDRPHLGAW